MIKKNFKQFSIIFIFSLFIMSIFLQPHFVHDTYNIYANGFTPLKDYLSQGRVITYFMTCFFSYLKFIPISLIQMFNVILGIFFLSISSCIIYNLIDKRCNLNNNNKILIIILSYLTIFTLYILEWFMFIEVSILCFGAMCSLLAAYILLENNNKKKYIYALIFYILSIFSYQTTISIGGATLVLFYLYDNKNKKLFDNIKKLFILFIPYIISLICNYLFMKLPFFALDIRSSKPNIIYNIIYILKSIYSSIIKSYNFYPFMFIPLIILILFFIMIYNKNIKYLFNYLLTLFSLWFLSILPAIFMNSSTIYTLPRTVPFIPSLMSFSAIMILLNNKKSLKNKLFVSTILLVFGVLIFNTIKIQNESIKNSIKDIENTKTIIQKIEEYEKNNDIKIVKIIFIESNNVHLANKNMIQYSDVSIRALNNYWQAKSIFNYVSKRKFIFEQSNNKNIFKNYNTDDFNLNQLKFINNNLYVYAY